MSYKQSFLDKVASTRFQREVQHIYDSLASLEKRERQGELGESGIKHRQRLYDRLRSLEEAFGRAMPGDMGTRTVRPLGVGGQSAAFQTVGDVPIKTKALQSQIDKTRDYFGFTPEDQEIARRAFINTGEYKPGFHVVKVTPPEMANLPAFSQTIEADGVARNTHPRSAVAFDPPADGKGRGTYSKATPLTPEHIIRARSNIAQQFGEGAAKSYALLPYNVPGSKQQGVVQVQEYLPYESVPYTSNPDGSVTKANLQGHLDAVDAVLSKLPKPTKPESRHVDRRGVAVDVVENAPALRRGASHDPEVVRNLDVAVNSKGEYKPNTLNASAQVRGDHNFGDIRAENIRRTHDGVPKLIDAYDFTHEPLVVDDGNAKVLDRMSAVERQKELGAALRGATHLTEPQLQTISKINAHTHASPWNVHGKGTPSSIPPNLPAESPHVSPHIPPTHTPSHTSSHAHTQTPTTSSARKFPWGLVAGLATPLALGAGAAVLNHYADRDTRREDNPMAHQKHAATRGVPPWKEPNAEPNPTGSLEGSPLGANKTTPPAAPIAPRSLDEDQAQNDSLPEDQRFRLTRPDRYVDAEFFERTDEGTGGRHAHRNEPHLISALRRERTVRARSRESLDEPTSLENLQLGKAQDSLFTPQERSNVFRAIPKTPPLAQNPLAGDLKKPTYLATYFSHLTDSSGRRVRAHDIPELLKKRRSDDTDLNNIKHLPTRIHQEILGQGVANLELPIRIATPEEHLRRNESDEFINAIGLNRPLKDRDIYVRGLGMHSIPGYFDKLPPAEKRVVDDPSIHAIFDRDEKGDFTKRRGAKGFTGFVQNLSDSVLRSKDPDQSKGLDRYLLAPRLSPEVIQWSKGIPPITTHGEVEVDVQRNIVDEYNADLINLVNQSGHSAHQLSQAHHALRSDPRFMAELERINDLKHRKYVGGDKSIDHSQLQGNVSVLEPHRKLLESLSQVTQEDVDKAWTNSVAKPFMSHVASRGEGALSRLLHPLAKKKLDSALAGRNVDQVIGLGEANLAQNRFAVSSALLEKERLQRELEDIRQSPHLVEGSDAPTPKDKIMTVPGWYHDRSKHKEFGLALGDEPHQHLTQEAVQPILDAMREHAESSPKSGASARTLDRWEEFHRSLPKIEGTSGQNAARVMIHTTPKEMLLRIAEATELHSTDPRRMEQRIQEVLSDHMRSGFTAVDVPATQAQRMIASHRENTVKKRIEQVEDYIRRREGSFGMNVEELVSIPLAVQSNREINPAVDWMAQAQRQQRRVATIGGYYNPYGTGLLDPSIEHQPTPNKVTTDFPSLEQVSDSDLYNLVREKEKDRFKALVKQYGSASRIPKDVPIHDDSIYTGNPGSVWFRNNVEKTYEFPGGDLLESESIPRAMNPYQSSNKSLSTPSALNFQPINLPAEVRKNVEKIITNLTPQQVVQAQQAQEFAQFQQESARAYEVKQKMDALEKYRAAAQAMPQVPSVPSAQTQDQTPQPRRLGEELPPHHVDNPNFVNNLMESLKQQAQAKAQQQQPIDPSIPASPPTQSTAIQDGDGSVSELSPEEFSKFPSEDELNSSSSDRSAASGMPSTKKPLDFSKLTQEQFEQLEEEFARGDLDPKRFGVPPIDPNNKEQVYEHFRKNVEEGKINVHPDMARAIKEMTPEQFKQHMAASEEVTAIIKNKGLENVDPAAFAAAVAHAPHLKNVENLTKHMEKFKGFEKYIQQIGDVLSSVAKWFKPKAHNVLEGTYDELQPQNNLLRAISTHQHNPLEGTYASLQPDQGLRQSTINSHNVNSNEVLHDAGDLLSFLPSELGLSPSAIAKQEAQAASGDGWGSKLWKSVSTPRTHDVIDPAQVIARLESKPDLAPSALWERLNNAINKIELKPKHLVIPGLALGALGGSALYDYWNRRGSGGG